MNVDTLRLLGKIAKDIKLPQAYEAYEIVIDPLVNLLTKTQQEDLLKDGVWTLGYVLENIKEDKNRVSKIIYSLIEGLSSSDWYTRANSCWILGHIAENIVYPEIFSILAQAITSLMSALRDNESKVRDNAAEVLGHMASNADEKFIIDLIQVIEPLIEVLKDKDWKVRDNAIWSLGQIANKATPEILQQNLVKAIIPLTHLLNDEYCKVRSHAVDTINIIIKNIDDPKVVKNVIECLASF
ncbi:HEAT repeat domain-containing protein (plasmid) [Candidatus Trichorickettsia mobilis]|uniref:sister chromatid cohesion protein PDS5 n=1 Tax=Candidatus Trichorickettsia mobilis TaxID=1346319 RepID=UPI002B26202C|nr:sister chromatid cohesion protein PDS5 [Candidatus Trichorickettsia mobilis]WPY01796.1 HEAT repeat domain-containing protein [Candidatus Trichorickettsia mobilis]